MAGPCLEAEREKPVPGRQRMVDEPLGPGGINGTERARWHFPTPAPALKTLGRRCEVGKDAEGGVRGKGTYFMPSDVYWLRWRKRPGDWAWRAEEGCMEGKRGPENQGQG